MRAFYMMLVATISVAGGEYSDDKCYPFLKHYLSGRSGMPDMCTFRFPYDEIKSSALGVGNSVEEKIDDSTQTAKRIFGRALELGKPLGLAMHAGAITKKVLKSSTHSFAKMAKIVKFMPAAGDIIDIVTGFMELFEDEKEETDWKKQFHELFAELMPEALIKQSNEDIGNFLDFVRSQLPIINKAVTVKDEYFAELDRDTIQHPGNCINNLWRRQEYINNKTFTPIVAGSLYTTFRTYVTSFTNRESTKRQHPSIALPSLIEMSFVVSIFEPVLIELFGNDAQKLSCVTRNAIYNFLPFVLEDRLNKLKDVNQVNMIKVRNAPYNQSGYNTSEVMYCWPESKNIWVSAFKPTIIELQNMMIFEDTATNEKYIYQVIGDGTSCEIGYAQHLRRSIEKMFEIPFEIADQMCNRSVDTTGKLSSSNNTRVVIN